MRASPPCRDPHSRSQQYLHRLAQPIYEGNSETGSRRREHRPAPVFRRAGGCIAAAIASSPLGHDTWPCAWAWTKRSGWGERLRTILSSDKYFLVRGRPQSAYRSGSDSRSCDLNPSAWAFDACNLVGECHGCDHDRSSLQSESRAGHSSLVKQLDDQGRTKC